MQTHNTDTHTGTDVSIFLKPKISVERSWHCQEFFMEINFTLNQKGDSWKLVLTLAVIADLCSWLMCLSEYYHLPGS